MRKDINVSFVIPLYRSEKTIDKVIKMIADLGLNDWEAILVNDCSPDNVEKTVEAVKNEYGVKIKYLRLSKNQGQHQAILLGLNYVEKDYVITIDDDGQNEPVEAIKLLEKLIANDLDIVYGSFSKKNHNFFRNFVSNLNLFISKYTIGNHKQIPLSNVRAMTKDLALTIASNSSVKPYIDGLVFSVTSRIDLAEIGHKERLEGKSGYNFKKLMRLWFNHFIGYSNLALQVFSGFCFLVSFVGFLGGVIYFILTINNESRPEGWLSLYMTLTILFSILFFFLGILGEYVLRIYNGIYKSQKILISKKF